jgi:hypothetical protein
MGAHEHDMQDLFLEALAAITSPPEKKLHLISSYDF